MHSVFMHISGWDKRCTYIHFTFPSWETYELALFLHEYYSSSLFYWSSSEKILANLFKSHVNVAEIATATEITAICSIYLSADFFFFLVCGSPSHSSIWFVFQCWAGAWYCLRTSWTLMWFWNKKVNTPPISSFPPTIFIGMQGFFLALAASLVLVSLPQYSRLKTYRNRRVVGMRKSAFLIPATAVWHWPLASSHG